MIGRLARARAGTAALEFALLAPLFLLMIFGIFGLSIALFYQSSLDYATATGARQIYLCQSLTNPAANVVGFADTVCNLMSAITSCANVQVYVVSGAAFSALQPPGYDASGNLVIPPAASNYLNGTLAALSANPPTAQSYGITGSDVYVQTSMLWPAIPGPLLSFFSGTGAPVLVSRYALRVTCG